MLCSLNTDMSSYVCLLFLIYLITLIIVHKYIALNDKLRVNYEWKALKYVVMVYFKALLKECIEELGEATR
jgi:hypothetical protein